MNPLVCVSAGQRFSFMDEAQHFSVQKGFIDMKGKIKSKKQKSPLKLGYQIVIGVLTLFAALMAAAGFLSGYIHPTGHEWVSFLGLILLPVLAVNMVLLGLCCVVRSHWGWVSLGALVLNIPFLLSLFQVRLWGCSAVDEGIPVKMITYNVNNFHTHGRSQLTEITGWISDERPDIVCLQECPLSAGFTLDSLQHYLQQFPYACSTYPASEGSSLVVLSRFPIVLSEAILYPGSGNKSLKASLVMGEDTVSLYSNHLQTTSVNNVKPRLYQAKAQGDAHEGKEAAFQMAFQMKQNAGLRARQADFMRQLMEGDDKSPHLVCGDFNDTPASYTYHQMKGKLTDGFRDCGSGFGFTFRELRRLFRIDYIFYSSHFRGYCYESPNLPYSDHNPVVWTGCLK